MLNISSILRAVLNDLMTQSGNIKVIDDQHIVDKLSGVEFHLYDDYFQMTRGSDKPVSVSSFSEGEKTLIMQIKDLITNPEVTQDKKLNYKKYVDESRNRFSSWFEQPVPVTDSVQEEVDAEEYVR